MKNEIVVTPGMKIKDLNIKEAVDAELVNERKDAIIRTTKNLQLAIAKSKAVSVKLEKKLEELMEVDVNELINDPYWKNKLMEFDTGKNGRYID